jgi:hypothetical protein
MKKGKDMPPAKGIDPPDKTVLKALALGGMLGGGAPSMVDVKTAESSESDPCTMTGNTIHRVSMPGRSPGMRKRWNP